MALTLRTLRVLLTGFTPIDSVDLAFAKRDTNPSGDCARASKEWKVLRGITSDHQINQGECQGIVYDVTFSNGPGDWAEGKTPQTGPGAADLLEADLLRIRPDVVISMGYINDADYFRLEHEAHDDDADKADNRGFRPKAGRRQYPGEPAELDATLPLDAIKRGWQNKNIAFRDSSTAGQYVCNDVFYRLMRVANAGRLNGTKILKAGFIHVPDPLLVNQNVVNDAIKLAVECTLSAIDPASYADLPATTTLLRHG